MQVCQFKETLTLSGVSQKEDGNRRVHMVETEELKWTDLCGKLGGSVSDGKVSKKVGFIESNSIKLDKVASFILSFPFFKNT